MRFHVKHKMKQLKYIETHTQILKLIDRITVRRNIVGKWRKYHSMASLNADI